MKDNTTKLLKMQDKLQDCEKFKVTWKSVILLGFLYGTSRQQKQTPT